MSKKIAILAPSAIPYEVGGAEKLWWGMREALARYGNAFAELIKLPCPEKSFLEIINSYEAFSQVDLNHFDMLITTKYPAWLAKHPNHVCYMQHTLRGLYDSYGCTGLPETVSHVPARLEKLLALVRQPKPGRADLPEVFELARSAATDRDLPRALFSFPGPLIREIVHFFDRVALAPGEIKAYLAISGNVASRKDYFPPGVPIKILHHPSDLKGFYCEKGRYFFTASRLHATKRIKLLCEAMRHVPLDISLKIAGTGPQLNALKEHFAQDRRIEFLGYVPDEEMTRLYAGAICVPYAPIDEDYGLITLEAMKSGKPVITTPDAGGVREFVTDGETGYIVPALAPELGAALTRLGRDPDLAAALGENARRRVEHITWQETVESLLAHVESPTGSIRPIVLVCAPFRADREGAGGPRRLYHFVRQLALTYAVRLLCYGPLTQAGPMTTWEDTGIREITLPWPQHLVEAAKAGAMETGQSCEDAAIWRHCAEDPLLARYLLEESRGAVCAILSHPWLYPAVKGALPTLPLVYDAHNVEADMKKAVFGGGPYAEEARSLEAEVCARACGIFACSSEDARRFEELYRVPSTRLTVLANGCEIQAQEPDADQLRKRLAFSREHLLIFVGSDHRPNVEAAKEIFKIARQLPQLQFLLAGSVCSSPVIAPLPRPVNLHLLGKVSEKVKNILLTRADLALNPVETGSGVNLKIMEYLAFGTPCLSTPFGSRGLPKDLAPALQIAPLAEFPEQIMAILKNPPPGQTLAETALRIGKEFAWSNTFAGLRAGLETSLQEITGAPAD